MRLFCLCIAFLISGAVLAASTPTQGVFTSVKGDVQVKFKKNKKTKAAQKDLTVFEGDTVTTKAGSEATIRFFDGSELKISQKTKFTLTALKKPTEQDKVMKFKLFIGKLVAEVKKLSTSKSSFEIEAGGVVCGVRGTSFFMSNDGGSKPLVVLQVYNGSVYAIDGNGNHYIFNQGPPITFEDGSKSNNNGNSNNPSDDKKKTDNAVEGSSDSNGAGGDNPAGSLADLSNQFQTGVLVNGDNTLNNPSVQGSVQVNIHPHLGY